MLVVNISQPQPFGVGILCTSFSVLPGELLHFGKSVESCDWITETEAKSRLSKNTIQSPCTLLYHPDDYVSNDLVGWHSSDPVLLEGVAVYSVYHLLYHYGFDDTVVLCGHGPSGPRCL